MHVCRVDHKADSLAHSRLGVIQRGREIGFSTLLGKGVALVASQTFNF